VGGRGNKFGGLLVWVVIGGGIVIGSIVSGVGRGGRTNLSVMGLTCSALLGVAGVVLEVGVGGWRESNGVGCVEGALALSVVASALRRAGPSSSHCKGPVDYFQQAFGMVWQLRW